ncbi:e610a0fa-f21b-461a-a0f9-ed4409500678 [Sclerotinia trifoliorum]|uniref:E610a0fa-f21b-461a-a0f9-ed4409500678 n=1 Tax=Sclerotinia trifoliorum TaxID=28548 RepID=A0A8H2W4Z1_9HELO|nr:e610a0fa-f21b-461a-a0f9-ed4409500678 [Sclerotinia trifoliorum]
MSEPKDIPPFISTKNIQQIVFGGSDAAPGSPIPSITGHTGSPMGLLMGSQKIREGFDLIAEGMASEGIQIPTTPRPTERKSDALNQHRLDSGKQIPPFAANANSLNPDPNLERPRRGPDDQPHQQQSKQNESLLHQAKLLVERFEQLAASNERNSDATTKLTEKLGGLETNLVSFDGLLKFLQPNFRTFNRLARELVDGKPTFAGLVHLNHSSKYDNNPSVWQGITLHAQDRPFTVRVLMQNIQTAISNLHPDKPTKGIELTEVFFVWDDNGKNEYRGDFNRSRYNRILGRGEADGSIQEDALVNNNLEAMMARDQGYIHVKYLLDKVEHSEWCGCESE